MTAKLRPRTILYFGDQTDPWSEGIDQVYKDSLGEPWLHSVLSDITRAFKEESRGMNRHLWDSVGDYTSLLQLAERYRHETDEMGMAHAMLLHALRAVRLLQ